MLSKFKHILQVWPLLHRRSHPSQSLAQRDQSIIFPDGMLRSPRREESGILTFYSPGEFMFRLFMGCSVLEACGFLVGYSEIRFISFVQMF